MVLQHWRIEEKQLSNMKFNKAECKVLYLVWGNPKYNYTGWVENGLKAALMRRTWWCWIMRSLV